MPSDDWGYGTMWAALEAERKQKEEAEKKEEEDK